MRILVPFRPQIGGGGVITVAGDYPGQAFYWELVSVDEAGQEGPPLGALRWDRTMTDLACLSTNVYVAPTSPALAGRSDRVKVRWGTI